MNKRQIEQKKCRKARRCLWERDRETFGAQEELTEYFKKQWLMPYVW